MKVSNVVAVLVGAGLVKLYGEYKYYSGKVDANNFNKVIIDIQSEFIDQLCKELKEKNEEES